MEYKKLKKVYKIFHENIQLHNHKCVAIRKKIGLTDRRARETNIQKNFYGAQKMRLFRTITLIWNTILIIS